MIATNDNIPTSENITVIAFNADDLTFLALSLFFLMIDFVSIE